MLRRLHRCYGRGFGSGMVVKVVKRRQRRIRAMEVLWPLFAPIFFGARIIDKVFLRWWLGPLIQAKANQSLWGDIEHINCLRTNGQLIREKHTTVQPFDYASVCVVFENMRFCFTRGRDELNVSLSPLFAPKESYELSVVIAALDSTTVAEVPDLTDLSKICTLLSARLNELTQAFSDRLYPEFKKKLSV
jgi:hypothetical protein